MKEVCAVNLDPNVLCNNELCRLHNIRSEQPDNTWPVWLLLPTSGATLSSFCLRDVITRLAPISTVAAVY